MYQTVFDTQEEAQAVVEATDERVHCFVVEILGGPSDDSKENEPDGEESL